jgi:hypothetical protein
VLQQGLQTGALKHSAWQNATSGTIYSALERARDKHTTRTRAPTTIHFLEPQHLELLLEVNMASRTKSGSSALQTVFTAPTFRATVGDALRASSIVASKFGVVKTVYHTWHLRVPHRRR